MFKEFHRFLLVFVPVVGCSDNLRLHMCAILRVSWLNL